MKYAVLMAAVMTCHCTLAFAQAQSGAMHEGHKNQLDTNKDGQVQRSEYQAFMRAAFAGLDKNKNGVLERSEAQMVLSADQFAATDTNSNGSVSQTEFMNRVMADFAAADRSGDGKLQ